MNTVVQVSPALSSGFSDLVFDSQAAFRAILNAVAYPGRMQTFRCKVGIPSGFDHATTVACLTLVDGDTTLWLEPTAGSDETRRYISFHCGAPVVSSPTRAAFAVVGKPDAMPRLHQFAQGEDKYPDRSTTVILQVPSLDQGPRTIWSGPGVNGSVEAHIGGLPDWFWDDWQRNNQTYPLGIDVLFACADAVIGLPRTIKVEV
jgi:alpha-D-ribose 1-methylphosphonate 5-triphosphate synthase subunit PhnH